MSTPWYIEAEPLAIIAAMTKPEIEHSEKRYVLTVDRFTRYVGPQIDALATMHEARFNELNAQTPFPLKAMRDLLETDPQAIAGALFGAANSNSYQNELPEWKAIRRNVAKALKVAA
jgi:hypothetical protein